MKKEVRELVAKGEASACWASFNLTSGFAFLVYSTLVAFLVAARADVYICYKAFVGIGCTENKNSVLVYLLIVIVLVCCYGVNFYHSFWPIISSREKFS